MSDNDEFDEVMKAAEAADPADTHNQSIWDTDDAVSLLRAERTITDENPEQMAKRLLEQAAPLAAGRIIHIALHSSNDNTSFAAARYITDLMYEGAGSGDGKAKWEKMLAEAVDEVELAANKGRG